MEESHLLSQEPNPLESTKANPAKAVDRVTLGPDESAKVVSWLTQLGLGSAGFLELTKSDIVNFLIRQHLPTLSAKEIKKIRSAHYDPIRHINWITPRLKEALAKSDIAQVAALQHEIRSIELSVISKLNEPESKDGASVTKQPRKRRKSTDTIEDAKLPHE